MVCSTTTAAEDQPKGSAANPHVFKSGLTWNLLARLKKADGSPFDLTGYTGRSEIRVNPEGAGPPVATWTVVINTTELGRADLELGALTTCKIQPGNYVFDIEYELDSDPNKVLKGSEGTQHMRVEPGVTKP